ncbi:MAG: hypothetical protein Q8M16_24885, partial [Pirellulaceae bacterium]|nr:hypothetical protein [Pirellulaceae bacterium]
GERIGAAPPTEAAFAAAVTQSTLAGRSAELLTWPVAEAGVEPAPGAKASQIARIVIDDHAWYIKLEGDRKALNGFAAEFQDFLANTKSAE